MYVIHFARVAEYLDRDKIGKTNLQQSYYFEFQSVSFHLYVLRERCQPSNEGKMLEDFAASPAAEQLARSRECNFHTRNLHN